MELLDFVEQLNALIPPAKALNLQCPSAAKPVMTQLVDAFRIATVEQQAAVRLTLGSAASWSLLGYAWGRAKQAVWQKSGEMMAQGLLALAIEDGRYDVRESIVRMAVLYRSAQKLGLNAGGLFADAAELATNPMLKAAMRQFPSRLPAERDLDRAFLLIEETTVSGFSYRSQPQRTGWSIRRKMWWQWATTPYRRWAINRRWRS